MIDAGPMVLPTTLDGGQLALPPQEPATPTGYFRRFWWEHDLASVPRVVLPGSVSEISVQDRRYQRVTDETTQSDYDFAWRQTRFLANEPISFASSDPAILSHEGGGFFRYRSSGTATLTASSPSRTVTVPVEAAQRVSSTDTYIGPVPGSLRGDLHSQIDQRLDGQMELFAIYDLANKVFQRNGDAWLADVDLTGLVVCTSDPYWPTGRGGMLLTPRHLLCCEHWPLSVGLTVWFQDRDGRVITRQVVNVVTWKTLRPNGYEQDFALAKLDGPADACTVYRVPPADWRTHMPLENPASGLIRNVPLLVLDQTPTPANKRGILLNSQYWRWPSQWNGYRFAADHAYRPLSDDVIPGDSGSPVCWLVDGQLVVLSTLWQGDIEGYMLGDYLDVLAEAIDCLGSEGYQPQTADLSGFAAYQ